jgi:putative pyruvate formate lyase activating enzyme
MRPLRIGRASGSCRLTSRVALARSRFAVAARPAGCGLGHDFAGALDRNRQLIQRSRSLPRTRPLSALDAARRRSTTLGAGGPEVGERESGRGLLWSWWWVMDSLAWPAYLSLGAEEVAARAEAALRLLGPGRCGVCPRLCKVNRLADQRGLCAIGRQAVVASHFPHFGEENCLRGRNGSGTIFFSGCNLRCVFCQNFDISWQVQGEPVSPGRLAAMMLALQDRGCHNINFVTPEHVVPQILEALPLAIENGLGLPIVYNTSSYDSLDSLRLMDGIVDIYMPDLKVWTRERARRYLRMPGYPQAAQEAVKEMNRQVGPLLLGENGLARRGLLVRHLVMPGMLDETRAILRFVAEELGAGTYVNLMAQYCPAGLVGRSRRDSYEEINRRLARDEYQHAVRFADEVGLRRLDRRSRASGLLLAATPAPAST